MGRIQKRFMALLLSVCISCGCIPGSAFAADTQVIPGEIMQSALTPQQYFVYQISQILIDDQTSMYQTLVDDDYFDDMSVTGVIESITNNIGRWISGTAEKDFYLDAITECLTLEAEDENEIPWEMALFVGDHALECLEENEIFMGHLSDWQLDAMNVYKISSNVMPYSDSAIEALSMLKKVSYYSGALLNAVQLLAEHTHGTPDIQSAAKSAVVAAYSDKMADKFAVWSEQFLQDAQGMLLEELISMFTFEILEWTSFVKNLVAGDVGEQKMEEFFYMNLQMEIAATIHSILNEYPMLTEANYSDEDLKNLWDLTLLYLKCGKLGFSYACPLQKEACMNAYHELQSWEIPWNESVPFTGSESLDSTITNTSVNITDYNVPGNLSVGDTCIVFGNVSSDELLKTVIIEISGPYGTRKYLQSDIYANEFELYKLDQQIAFDRFRAGDYTYVVCAETVDGIHIELIRSCFTIQPEDGNMTITNYRLPHPMTQGTGFPVRGIINSQTTIREVSVEVLDINGNYMTGDCEIGSFLSYNLINLDSATRFDILQPGIYSYVVKARSDSGSEVLVNQKFIIK